MVNVELPLLLPDGNGTLVKMTDPEKVKKLSNWCAGVSHLCDLKILEDYIEGDLNTFWPRFNISMLATYLYLEQFKDLYVAYQQFTYRNYIMAGLLVFFMYLPVLSGGYISLKRYYKA